MIDLPRQKKEHALHGVRTRDLPRRNDLVVNFEFTFFRILQLGI